jgi:hypothetical protein
MKNSFPVKNLPCFELSYHFFTSTNNRKSLNIRSERRLLSAGEKAEREIASALF